MSCFEVFNSQSTSHHFYLNSYYQHLAYLPEPGTARRLAYEGEPGTVRPLAYEGEPSTVPAPHLPTPIRPSHFTVGYGRASLSVPPKGEIP